MAETFPPTLQEFVNESGFGLQTGETAIRSDMDISLAKERNRYTKGIDVFRTTIDIYKTDYLTLDSFYKTTLNGGTGTFNYDHPITEVESEFRFVGAPSYSPLGGGYFRVTMTWELMP